MNVSLLLESACLAAAEAHTFTAPVNKYKGSGTVDSGPDNAASNVQLPALIFHVASADMYVKGSAARRCRLRIITRSQRDDSTDAVHYALAKEVADWVNSTAFYQAVNSYSGVTLLLAIPRGDSEGQPGRELETVIEMDVDAVPGDLS